VRQISEESLLRGSGAIAAKSRAARSRAAAVAPTAGLPPGLVGLRYSLASALPAFAPPCGGGLSPACTEPLPQRSGNDVRLRAPGADLDLGQLAGDQDQGPHGLLGILVVAGRIWLIEL
jgi:hypothetical protein